MEQSLSNRIVAFKSGVSRVNQQLSYEQTNITRLEAKIKQLEADKALLLKAVGLIDRTIQVISANGIGKIESIVTAGLQQVFGDKTIGFLVEKKESARGYQYRLLVRHGDTIGNPMTSFGGGVQNVVAFLLRVIMIKRFKLAKMLVLDENFANVGNEEGHEYLENASEMLRTLCDRHGFTILAITHQPILASYAHHIYKLNIVDEKPVLNMVSNDEVGGLGYGTETPEDVAV